MRMFLIIIICQVIIIRNFEYNEMLSQKYENVFQYYDLQNQNKKLSQ